MSFFLCAPKTLSESFEDSLNNYSKGLVKFENKESVLFIGLNKLDALEETQEEILLDGLVHRFTDSGFSIEADILGKKPVYYNSEHGIYSSETFKIVELLGSAEKCGGLDKTYLSNCLKWGYDMTGRTPFNSVKRLAPGYTLEFLGKSKVVLSEPTDSFEPNIVSNPVSRIREIIEEEILEQSRVNPCASLMLSGGLDSSIIYGVLKKNGISPEILSFENGETEYLPEGVPLQELPEMDLEEVVNAMQCPIDLGSTYPMVASSKLLMEQGFTEVFQGTGPDELLGGYTRIHEYDSQWSDFFMEMMYYQLPRQDRVEREYGVRVLTPFLNKEFIEIALGLEYQSRINKRILQDAFSDVVPEKVLNRKKKPLKSKSVINGKINYRNDLVQAFINNLVNRGLLNQ